MKYLLIIWLILFTTMGYAANVDYLGVARQIQVGGGSPVIMQYIFMLPLGSCNEIVFNGATPEELAMSYCYVRYNTVTGNVLKRSFHNTLDEAEDALIAENAGIKKFRYKGQGKSMNEYIDEYMIGQND